MSNKLNQLFEGINEIDPPIALAGFVFSEIAKEKNRITKRQLFFSYVSFAGSFTLAIYVGTVFGQAFLQSEFWTMLSLVFSDIAIVMRNWDTFFLSLLETFPVAHAMILLVPIFLMLASASYYFNSKTNYRYKYNLITS
ncbi:MAG: hypothetical protein WAV73_04005 [Candidatus Moraniibacteriota bacterium]